MSKWVLPAQPKTRGTVNGIGQSLSSLGRAVGPIVGSLLFAWSEHSGKPRPLRLCVCVCLSICYHKTVCFYVSPVPSIYHVRAIYVTSYLYRLQIFCGLVSLCITSLTTALAWIELVWVYLTCYNYTFERGTVHSHAIHNYCENIVGHYQQTFNSVTASQSTDLSSNFVIVVFLLSPGISWPMNYHFTFYLLTIFSLFTVGLSLFLPQSAEKKRENGTSKGQEENSPWIIQFIAFTVLMLCD